LQSINQSISVSVTVWELTVTACQCSDVSMQRTVRQHQAELSLHNITFAHITDVSKW